VIVEEFDIVGTPKTTNLLCNKMAASSLMLPLEESEY
jgi:hypothetical protein